MSPMDEYRAACTRVVDEAKQKLVLGDLWDLGSHSGQEPSPTRDAVVCSPLRPDKKPNFSVFAGGRAFDDKAREGVKGGVWEFVALARPDMEPSAIARLLVERAGLQWPAKARFFGQGSSAGPAGDETARAKLMREERLARKRADEEQRDRQERSRRAAREVPRAAGKLLAWPACVQERWEEGAGHRDARLDVMVALCERRGWPTGWIDALGAIDALAFPVESRYEIGDAQARRMVAFRVEAPIVSGTSVQLVPVGVHQKFFNIAEKLSGWRFFPTRKLPPIERCSSYERALHEVASARQTAVDEAMVPPLPFVVGDLAAPRLVVILEGQWDALTFLGALGGLHADGDGLRGVAVFGVRGAKGTGVFLAHWGGWIRAVRPMVWLLPDNDAEKTGAHWFPPLRASDRRPGKVYFSEQLTHLGARRVVVTPLRHSDGAGKDFNDYYRANKPDAQAMANWLEKLRLT